MKRKLVGILLALATAVTAGLVPMGMAGANAEPTPPAYAEEVDLIAGQSIDVGAVYVWNDASTLYVKYQTDDGWLLKETHLQVVSATGVIPVTKKGNPIPGKFAHSNEFDPPQDWDYCALDLAGTTSFQIAAHAVVMKETSTELVANGGFEVPALGGSWAIVPLSDPSLGWNVDPTNPPWDVGQPQGLELQKIWTPNSGAQYAELDAYDPVRISQTIGPCASGFYSLRYSWSPRPNVPINLMEVYWNGSKIATHSASGSGNADTVWTDETFTYMDGPSGSPFVLAFQETGPHDQLGMLLDSVSVVCVQVESAWAAGTAFAGANWATYFTYDVTYTVGAELVPCPINYPGPSYPPGGGYVLFTKNAVSPNLEVIVVLQSVLPDTRYDIYFGVDVWGSPGKMGTCQTDGDGNGQLDWGTTVSAPATHYLNIDVVLEGTGADIYELPNIHNPPATWLALTYN